VSIERIASGPGIVDIYETLAALEGRPVASFDDRTIWTMAMSGEDSLAAAAADRVCLSLGSVAGDLAWRKARAGWSLRAGWACASATASSARAFPNALSPKAGSKI